MGRTALVAAALLCALASGGALAQGRGRSGTAPRTGTSDSENLPPSVPPAVSTLAPVQGITGPKLQSGAVVCQSEDDLRHRAQVNARRTDGDPEPGNPLAGCHIVGQDRAVEVVARHGLGRTEVKVKQTGETGWTDVYLP